MASQSPKGPASKSNGLGPEHDVSGEGGNLPSFYKPPPHIKMKRQVAERFRAGTQTPDDIKRIEAALTSDDFEFLEWNVFQYLKHSPTVNEPLLLRYLQSVSHPRRSMTVEAIIQGFSERGFRHPDYVRAVHRFAAGVPWDSQDSIRMAALWALITLGKGAPTADMKAIVRNALGAESHGVRNAAVAVAQYLYGIAAPDVRDADGDEEPKDKLPPQVLEWLERP